MSSEMGDMPVPDAHGRTLWDLFHEGRFYLLVFVIIAVVGIILYICRGAIDGESVLQFMDVYWPVFFSPLAGWVLGKIAVDKLYRAEGVYIHVFYPEYHQIRIAFIPDAIFRDMEQCGNSVLYRSTGGRPVYLAKHLDISRRFVDFGMIHSVPAIEAMTYEEGYVRWQDEAERAMKENILYQTYPEFYAAGLTRRSVKEVLDMFSKAFRHQDTDYTDKQYTDPGQEPEQGMEEEDVQ